MNASARRAAHRGRFCSRTEISARLVALAALATTTLAAQAPPPAPTLLDDDLVVAGGGDDDFCEVRHVVVRGSHEAIGRRLAELARDRCGAKPWRVSDPLVTRVQREYFGSVWPQHLERMRGAAAAFGTTVDDPTRNFAKVAFHVADFFGCSVVYYPPNTTADGRGILSRNLDFTTGTMTGRRPRDGSPAALSKPFVIESYPDDGYASLFVASMDLLGSAFDGINEKGLTAALLTDREAIDRYSMQPLRDLAVGLSEIQLVRYLLDTCATVDEAKAAVLRAKHYYGFVPCHYLIADRAGNAVVWEQSPSRNRDHFLENPDAPLVTTNFMLHLHDDPLALDARERGLGSVRRYQAICRGLDELADGGTVDTTTIKALSRKVQMRSPAPPPQVPFAAARTIWHALYCTDDSSLEVDFYLGDGPPGADGQPTIRRSGYLRFELARR